MDDKKLDELNKWRKTEVIADKELEREEQKLSDEEEKAPSRMSLPLGIDEHWSLVLMNFLILIPFIGWIAPIIFWFDGKSISAKINRQGKYILNWYISGFLYFIVYCTCSLFNMQTIISNGIGIAYHSTARGYEVDLYPIYFEKFFESPVIAIGAILIIIAGVMFALSILFPIIGGIRGWTKHTWKYPLSIPFFK